jgi:hypothetical protein
MWQLCIFWIITWGTLPYEDSKERAKHFWAKRILTEKQAGSPVPGADTYQMLGQLSLGTTTFATDRASERPQTGVQLDMSHTVLFQGIRPLERFTTVVTQVRALIIMDVVHVTDVVLLPTRLVWTLIKKTSSEYLHSDMQWRIIQIQIGKKKELSPYLSTWKCANLFH